MVTLGLESGGDEKMIALIQAARIILVALCLPFLIRSLTGVAPEPLRSQACAPTTSCGSPWLFCSGWLSGYCCACQQAICSVPCR